MNDRTPPTPDPNDVLVEPALREIASQLDARGAALANERAGLGDRIFAASVASLAAPVVAGRIDHARPKMHTPWARIAAAASIAAAAFVGVVLVRPTAPARTDAIRAVAVRPSELSAGGRSERLLVALYDSDAALALSDPATSDGAAAVALIRGHHVDDVAIELSDLLTTGGSR